MPDLTTPTYAESATPIHTESATAMYTESATPMYTEPEGPTYTEPAPGARPVPFVSVIIPVRNECEFTACCLDSVLSNGYPAGRLEVLAVDAGSDDGTRAVLEDYAARFPQMRMIDNPKKITPAALNLGLRAARGDLIVRVDAHARLAPGYIAQCVAWIETSGAANVGGLMRTLPRGPGLVAEAVALVLGHRFGVGDSAFRTWAPQPVWVDTVFGGCYRREFLERLGGFNERLPRGQDLELNLRLKRAGGRTLLVPSIRCDYFARCDAASFLKHNWTNGVWAIRPFVESEIAPVRPRHLVPLAFVLALVAALALWTSGGAQGPLPALLPAPASLGSASLGSASPVFESLAPGGPGAWPLVMLGLCYAAAAFAASAQLAWRRGDARLLPLLPVVFLGLHLAYGLGSLWGLLGAAAVVARRRVRRLTRVKKTHQEITN